MFFQFIITVGLQRNKLIYIYIYLYILQYKHLQLAGIVDYIHGCGPGISFNMNKVEITWKSTVDTRVITLHNFLLHNKLNNQRRIFRIIATY